MIQPTRPSPIDTVRRAQTSAAPIEGFALPAAGKRQATGTILPADTADTADAADGPLPPATDRAGTVEDGDQDRSEPTPSPLPFAQVVALLLPQGGPTARAIEQTGPAKRSTTNPAPVPAATSPAPPTTSPTAAPTAAPIVAALPETRIAAASVPPVPVHPNDLAKLARAGARRPGPAAEPTPGPAASALAVAGNLEPTSATAGPSASEPSPSSTAPVDPQGASSGGSKGRAPDGSGAAPRDGRAPASPAMTELIEHVEFGGPDRPARLELVHEAVGRLSVTLDAGPERTDVRLGSDDPITRRALAEAVPTLLRLAEERRVPVGSVEIGHTASPGGAGVGTGAERQLPDPQAERHPVPARASATPALHTAALHTTTRRTAGLFA